jgi:hypothetical protein
LTKEASIKTKIHQKKRKRTKLKTVIKEARIKTNHSIKEK